MSAPAWPTVRLGELCALVNGKAFKPADWSETGLPIIRIQNLNDATKPFNHWNGPLDRQVIVEPGDVLLAWSGTPGTSFGAHEWAGTTGVLNQHIFRVDLDESRIDKAWAVPAVNHQLEELIGKAHGGVGLRHVKKAEVQSLHIPLPPVAEQRRIAGLLRERLGAVERAREAAVHQHTAAEALPAAFLRDVFGPAEKEWPTSSLAELADIRGGIQKSPSRTPVEFHRPYLTVRNVLRGSLDLSNVERFEVTPDELESWRLKRGDLLIVEGNGSPNHIGRNALFAGEIEECVHQNHIIRVRVDGDRVLPAFVSAYLNSPAGIAQALDKARTTSGLYSLSAKRVGALNVPVPPLAVQTEVEAGIELRRANADTVRSLSETQLRDIEALPAALLREAFGGRL